MLKSAAILVIGDEVLSGRTVESLPLNGRNSSQLALLMPGAISPNPQAQTSAGGYSARPFVNGNREQTNNFTVDGLDVNETIDNRVAYQPVPDALAEISVETSATITEFQSQVTNGVSKTSDRYCSVVNGSGQKIDRRSDICGVVFNEVFSTQ